MTEAQVVLFDNEGLHPAQLEVAESTARFKIVACGRRFGKTFLAVHELIDAMLFNEGGIYWWVAPRLEQTEVAWRFFREAMPAQLVTYNLTRKVATLWNGATVQFKTSRDPRGLRSEGLDGLVMDEAADQALEVWIASLRPALADKKGWALLIGTFSGENWFYDLYVRGQQADRGEYKSWRFPSAANPYLDPIEIEEARATTPRAEFEQEWLANPMIYVGAVFDGADVQRAVERGYILEEWPETTETYAGLDWGHNVTSFQVCQEHPTTDAVRWIQEGNWMLMPLGPDPERKAPTKIDLIVSAARRHNILTIYADAAGATEIVALAAALDDAGVATEVVKVPFGKYKAQGITTRRWYLEQGMETISGECPELIRTTKRYHYKEGTEDVVKEDDHPVDAATAFYASRRKRLVGE